MKNSKRGFALWIIILVITIATIGMFFLYGLGFRHIVFEAVQSFFPSSQVEVLPNSWKKAGYLGFYFKVPQEWKSVDACIGFCSSVDYYYADRKGRILDIVESADTFFDEKMFLEDPNHEKIAENETVEVYLGTERNASEGFVLDFLSKKPGAYSSEKEYTQIFLQPRKDMDNQRQIVEAIAESVNYAPTY